jgi:hypothetical protein
MSPETTESLRRLALQAYNGMSHSPERRAVSAVEEAAQHLAKVRTWIAEHLPADMVEQAFAEYEAGWLQRYRAYLGSQVGTFSAMIAGPSNFPARRMEKRWTTTDRRYRDLVAFEKRAKRRIGRTIEEVNRPDDPAGALRAEIEQKEKHLADMKAANRVIRKKKLTEDEKVAAIVDATGWKEDTARRVVTTPDVMGAYGFPGYHLTSVGGKIKRLRAKLAVLESSASEGTERAEVAEGDGWKIEEDAWADRLRIYFEDIPSEDMRSALKRRGFRWSRREGAWQRQLTQQARIDARAVLGAA